MGTCDILLYPYLSHLFCTMPIGNLIRDCMGLQGFIGFRRWGVLYKNHQNFSYNFLTNISLSLFRTEMDTDGYGWIRIGKRYAYLRIQQGTTSQPIFLLANLAGWIQRYTYFLKKVNINSIIIYRIYKSSKYLSMRIICIHRRVAGFLEGGRETGA